MTLSKWLQRENRIIPAPARLPVALGVAVVFALALTIVSVSIYELDGSFKLDLSRPGFEVEQAATRSTSTQVTYDTTGPITRNAVDGFLQEFDDRAQELGKYGTFNDQALDDASLQIGQH